MSFFTKKTLNKHNNVKQTVVFGKSLTKRKNFKMIQRKRAYTIPEEILYTVCIAAWNLCRQHLSKFTSLKAYYTQAFITNALGAVQAAKQLSEIRQSIAVRKEARINLINATRQVRNNWQVLKVYIIRAFEASMVKTKLDAAGASLYARASMDNWSAIRSLIDTANTFIAGNLDELTANGNMPTDFQTTFKASGDACIDLSVIYSKANMEKEAATGTKADANNAIYGSVIEMLKDGQQIFKDDAIMKRQFTFSYLVRMHRGEGSASLRGYIVNSLNQPVAGAVILSQDQKYTGTTNERGYYRINRIAEGTYTFTISCPGYTPIVHTVTFAPGTASRADFEMTNVFKEVA
jgi:hypothetical protein